MAQTALTVTTLVQNNVSVTAGSLAVTFASDTTNGNSFPSTGREILLAWNSDSSAHTLTVSSVADSLGRTDSSLASYSVAATSIAAIECSQIAGWKQTDGTIHISSSNTLLTFAVLRF